MIGNFFVEQELTFEHVKVLTQALLEVARVDGVHDNEMNLIREFYDSCKRAGDPRLEDVVADGLDEKRVVELFGSPELAQLFVKSLILLGFADGVYAKVEDDLIRKYAKQLELSDEQVDSLHSATKEFLLGSLSHIQNLDALRRVHEGLNPS